MFTSENSNTIYCNIKWLHFLSDTSIKEITQKFKKYIIMNYYVIIITTATVIITAFYWVLE